MNSPGPIEPETKDWTWVLEKSCPACGFDTRAPERAGLASLATTVTERWLDVLDSDVMSAGRPAPGVWSPLEYACHVRDVLALAAYRVRLMVDEDDPLFANWDQDATAVEERYDLQDPAQARSDLATSGTAFAQFLSSVPDEAWERTGRRSDGAVFTVDTFTRYLLHDPIHHLTDVTGDRWA